MKQGEAWPLYATSAETHRQTNTNHISLLLIYPVKNTRAEIYILSNKTFWDAVALKRENNIFTAKTFKS